MNIRKSLLFSMVKTTFLMLLFPLRILAMFFSLNEVSGIGSC